MLCEGGVSFEDVLVTSIAHSALSRQRSFII